MYFIVSDSGKVVLPQVGDYSCPAGTFTCGSGECVKDIYICDGVNHCTDGTDEREQCQRPIASTDRGTEVTHIDSHPSCIKLQKFIS